VCVEEASRRCWESGHLPCSCCSDAFLFQWPLWWGDLSNLFLLCFVWCHVVWWCDHVHSPIGSGQDLSTTLAGYILHLASSNTPQSTTSLWRWNRYRVPKRRPTTIWRRENTQKNIFNIQITAKVWNQELLTYCKTNRWKKKHYVSLQLEHYLICLPKFSLYILAIYPRSLTWTTERGKLLGRHKHRLENNIKVDRKEIENDGEYLIYLCHDKRRRCGRSWTRNLRLGGRGCRDP
jgi:hypothetical protein